ncbi:OmpA family protein [Pontibacter roseus]|uniref:OmpA family protein n=1 Tax=Pontibacter roseus TaxID=336989 RepID=UPI000361CF38|nr:OmpA family protein [Pontibacter roseus]
MKTALLVFCFSYLISQATAQNLVKNPSLETLKNGVVGFRGVSGTPDIASRENQVMQYPPYYNPYLSAIPGRSVSTIQFGEICFCLWFSSGTSELMQAELRKPLKKNREYLVSLYTIRTSAAEPPIRDVTVHFTKRPLPATREVYGQEQHTLTGAAIPYLSLKAASAQAITSQSSWTIVSGVYKAKGGERYLTIGNFIGANKAILDELNPAESDTIKGYKTKGTYYCYDNLSVVPLAEAREATSIPDSPLTDSATTVNTSFAIGNTLTLGDVHFSSGESQILETAFPMLDSLAAFLRAKPEAVVEVQGHTDDVGSEEDNQRLSEQRAQAVQLYLLQQGIEPERITFQGHGEKRPKMENDSEESRARNRRVEIDIRQR